MAGFGALEAYRAERSHRAAATGVLRDYGEFAALSFEQRVTELLQQRFNNTFAVSRNNRLFAQGHATQECLSLLLGPTGPKQCDCAPTRLAGAWSFFTRLGPTDDGGEWGGRPAADLPKAAVLEATRNHARERYENGWNFALMQVEDGPLIAYTRLVSSTRLTSGLEAAADTLLYGVEVNRTQLNALYQWALNKGGLLPGSLTEGLDNSQVVRVDVLDDFGDFAFRSRPDEDHSFAAEVEGRASLGGGVIRASVVPEMADRLVIGGLPSDRTPVLLLIVLLATALAGAALVQLRRENHLARLRQDFVANVSHELRTPLAQVRLFTETLRLGRTRTEEQRNWALESIDRETVRLTHLVENILHFSRSERGVASTEREIVELGDEIRQAVDAFAPLVPESKGTLTVDVGRPLLAEVHRDSIRQVLLNFMDNAVRYGSPGQTVVVGAEAFGDSIRIYVDDDGPGVSQGERQRVFEPFHRGGQQGGTAVAGSGIGLSVVREIAEAHRGRTWVEDAPNGGARFVLEIPGARTASPLHFARDDHAGSTSASATGVA